MQSPTSPSLRLAWFPRFFLFRKPTHVATPGCVRLSKPTKPKIPKMSATFAALAARRVLKSAEAEPIADDLVQALLTLEESVPTAGKVALQEAVAAAMINEEIMCPVPAGIAEGVWTQAMLRLAADVDRARLVAGVRQKYPEIPSWARSDVVTAMIQVAEGQNDERVLAELGEGAWIETAKKVLHDVTVKMSTASADEYEEWAAAQAARRRPPQQEPPAAQEPSVTWARFAATRASSQGLPLPPIMRVPRYIREVVGEWASKAEFHAVSRLWAEGDVPHHVAWKLRLPVKTPAGLNNSCSGLRALVTNRAPQVLVVSHGQETWCLCASRIAPQVHQRVVFVETADAPVPEPFRKFADKAPTELHVVSSAAPISGVQQSKDGLYYGLKAVPTEGDVSVPLQVFGGVVAEWTLTCSGVENRAIFALAKTIGKNLYLDGQGHLSGWEVLTEEGYEALKKYGKLWRVHLPQREKEKRQAGPMAKVVISSKELAVPDAEWTKTFIDFYALKWLRIYIEDFRTTILLARGQSIDHLPSAIGMWRVSMEGGGHPDDLGGGPASWATSGGVV